MSPRLMGNGLIEVGEGVKMPERDAHDFYPTSWSVIEEAMKYLPEKREATYRAGDICAGSGRWGQAFQRYMPDAYLHGFELQIANPLPSIYHMWHQGDVLDTLHDTYLKYDVLFGNPSFLLFDKKHVGKFIRCLHNSLKENGVLILFGRSAIAESATRYKEIFSWWRPRFELTLVNRTSFYPEGHPQCGGVNATAHSIFVWVQGDNPYTVKRWVPELVNDDKYQGVHRGTNTYSDMIKLGLVPPEEPKLDLSILHDMSVWREEFFSASYN